MFLDGKVTVGDLLVVLSMVVTLIGVYTRLSIQIAELKKDIEVIKHWWNKCSEGNCPTIREIRAQFQFKHNESSGD